MSSSSSSEIQEKSAEMVLAEERLAEAKKTSADIADKIYKLRVISAKLNDHICRLDVPWERRKFVESHLDQYFKWADGSGKLPDSRPLQAIEDDAAAMQIAFNHVTLRLHALDAAAKMSLSEELVNEARILTLRSQDENLRAARALASVRGELGDDAKILVERGRSQKLEEAADKLTLRAAGLRIEAEERMVQLRELQKGGQ